MAGRDHIIRRHVQRWQDSSPGRPPGSPEPGPGQESVWDYPRPPRIEPAEAALRIEHRGVCVASTTRGLRTLETASPPTYYIPPGDVAPGVLEPSLTTSHCEWKGRASYWALRVGSVLVADAAWSYECAYPEFAALTGYLAFYPSAVDGCFVGDERARPQPGGFYGGWVTSRIVGPFKGEPGTGHW